MYYHVVVFDLAVELFYNEPQRTTTWVGVCDLNDPTYVVADETVITDFEVVSIHFYNLHFFSEI